MERRLSDNVFKSVPQRIAGALAKLACDEQPRRSRHRPQITLTHDQLAALVGTSRETTTKVLGEFAERGLLKLGRGRITLLDQRGLHDETGD